MVIESAVLFPKLYVETTQNRLSFHAASGPRPAANR